MPTMRSRSILFIDDEEKSRKYFGKIFRRQFEVMVAEDGEEGLSMLKERREEIGLVVTDQMMPRMTGLELLAEVKKVGPEVIRVMSTAYADSELVAAAIRDKLIEFFIRKPWDIEIVSATLEEAAGHYGRAGGGAANLSDGEPPSRSLGELPSEVGMGEAKGS